MATLELDIDNLEFLDLEDPDFAELLLEISETTDPSQQRTYQILDNLRNENLIEVEILKELEQKHLQKRHHDLALLQDQREMTGQLHDAFMLLKDEISDLNDKLGILDAVDHAQKKLEGPNKILDNLKVNLNQYNFDNEAPLDGKPKKYIDTNLANLVGTTPNDILEFNRKVSQSIGNEEDYDSMMNSPGKYGYGGAQFKKFGKSGKKSPTKVKTKKVKGQPSRKKAQRPVKNKNTPRNAGRTGAQKVGKGGSYAAKLSSLKNRASQRNTAQKYREHDKNIPKASSKKTKQKISVALI